MTDITTRGEFQDNIAELNNLESYDFENIFKLCYDQKTSAYFYNILRTINIPVNIQRDLYGTIVMPAEMPLTTLSYKTYGTIKLWWLICTVNSITNPVDYIPGGTILKIITPRHVPYVINLIKQNLVD